MVTATVIADPDRVGVPLHLPAAPLFRRIRERDPYPPWQAPALISWMGMRGAVSLAAALALPIGTDAGAGFPHRDLIIFLTFSVILGTLLIQGLTLAGSRARAPARGRRRLDRDESKARLKATKAALARIDSSPQKAP